MTEPATITVYVTNGTSTSQGNGPGYADLPADEALWLIGEGLAVRAATCRRRTCCTAASPVTPP
jgi:hypothetical protein